MEKFKEIYQYVLGAVIVLGVFVLLGLLIYNAIPEQNSEILNIVIGALIGAFTYVVGYFYGSSKGSHDKNKIISDKNDRI